MRRMTEAIIVLLFVGRAAVAGNLDPSFAGGIVHDSVGGIVSFANAVAIQPTGEIVAAGEVVDASEIGLIRVLADGTLDTSFGTGGRVRTPGGALFPTSLLLQPDGKIVVVTGDSSSGFVLRRYETNGTLDAGFGSGGLVATPTGAAAYGGVVDGAGRITVAGGGAIARYDSTGVPDATFGVGGLVALPSSAFARALVRQADGYVVVAGSASNGTDTDFWIARYDDGGVPDPAFGTGGAVTTPLGAGDDVAVDLLLQPDGRLVAAGQSEIPSSGDVVPSFVRYLRDGTPDSSFGSGGQVLFGLPGRRPLTAAALQGDGKIVAVGNIDDAPSLLLFIRPFLMRLTADGSVDPTFVSDASSSPEGTGFGDVAIQADGKIVTAGILATLSPVYPYTPTSAVVELRRYFAEGGCGNGIVDGDEECDAGSSFDPCCSSTHCSFQSSSTSCASDGDDCTTDHCDGAGICVHTTAPDGTTCDDGSLCTAADTCTNGVCAGQSYDDVFACAHCDPATGVLVGPRTDCKHTTIPGGAMLKMKLGATNRIAWRWRKGEATSIAELGDPITGGNGMSLQAIHELCVFDAADLVPVFSTVAFPNMAPLSCAQPPCWRLHGSSLTYRSNPPNQFGVTSAVVKAGPTGTAKSVLKGKGPNLFLAGGITFPSPPPYQFPLRVQFGARDGTCFEAMFSAAGMRSNTATSLNAKSD